MRRRERWWSRDRNTREEGEGGLAKGREKSYIPKPILDAGKLLGADKEDEPKVALMKAKKKKKKKKTER